MRLEQIEQIIQIAKSGSLNKAAKNMYMSQPNLSMSLKSLERELGVNLFSRTSRGMLLTEKGQQFLHYVSPLLYNFNQITDIVNTLSSEERMLLRVSSTFLRFVQNIFSQTINQFGSPRLICQYRETGVLKAIEDVSKQLSDIGIVYISCIKKGKINVLCDYKNIRYTPLLRAKVKILLRKNHPLNNSDKISISEIYEYPLINYGTMKESEIDELTFLGLGKNNVILVNSSSALINILQNTCAIAVMPEHVMNYYTEDNNTFENELIEKNLKSPHFAYEIGMLKRKNFIDNDATAYFAGKIKEYVQSVK